MLAEASRSVRAIASPTSSGTCEPPGASRKTKPPSRSEEKRARTASTSSTVAAMKRAYPRLILGCGNFGGIGSAPAFFGRGETKEQAFELMDAAWDAGITWFDTADAYGGGRSETYIGEWIGSRRPEGLRVTTKTFNPMDEGEDHGLAPARVRRQIESSLGRLGVERVDLYLTHDWDPDVPIAEVAGVFEQLVAAGKIGAYGLSNVESMQLGNALEVSRFDAVQNSYSLLDREPERGVIPICALNGIGFQAHSPLAGGWLTGRYRRDTPAPEGSRMTLRSEPYEHLRTDRVYDALEKLEHRGHPATLALAWLLADERVSVVLGPRRPVHLRPALDALANPLTPQEREALSDDFRLVPES
jgi:aryl-alcohol dehydrogenase-like predicted oxidoreductase